MSNPIVRLVGLVLRLLLPPSGRRRSGVTPPPVVASTPTCVVTAPTARCQARVPHARGSARERIRVQRQRRRALWLAVHGVDVGPRSIHGVEVAA
jgi:hypothetical protein